MAIGTDKLKAFAQKGMKGKGGGPQPHQENPGDQAFDAQHGEQPPEGSPEDMSLDNPENLSVEAMKHRLMEPHVGYLEMEKPVGALACGECHFHNEDGFCANSAVLAYVSDDKGHCNLFKALEGEAVQPDDWEGLKNAPDREGGEPKSEEKDEEPEDEEPEDKSHEEPTSEEEGEPPEEG
jgi:hypothetical protein